VLLTVTTASIVRSPNTFSSAVVLSNVNDPAVKVRLLSLPLAPILSLPVAPVTVIAPELVMVLAVAVATFMVPPTLKFAAFDIVAAVKSWVAGTESVPEVMVRSAI